MRTFVISTLVAAVIAVPCQAKGRGPTCFSSDQKPQFDIMEQAPPPPSDDAPFYPYFPATTIGTTRIDLLATTRATMPMYYWQWANHGPRRVPKSNLAIGVHPGVGTSVFFTSTSKANACTMAQTAALFGDEKEARDALQSAGVKRQTEIAPGELVDTCLVQNTLLPAKTAGVLLDYEVYDGRSPQFTEKFLVDFAKYVHSKGKKVILYTNPLNAPTQRLTGIDKSNVSALATAFDQITIFLWSGSREGDILASFEAQKAMIKPWMPEKIMTVFELNNTTKADAAAVADLMKRNSISSVTLWRFYGKQGGGCDLQVNVKIACLAFGRC